MTGTPPEQDDYARENAREITELRRALTGSVVDAARATATASAHLAALRSNRVYDIDLAEGRDGHDLAAELEAAERALRNAARIMHDIDTQAILPALSPTTAPAAAPAP